MNLIKESWSKADYSLLKDYLFEISSEKLRDFNLRLTPGEINIIGVKIPELRKIAKAIAKGNYADFLALNCGDSREERMLHGFVIGYAKLDFDEFIKYLKAFIPKINSWAVCDTCTSSFKIIEKNKQKFVPLLSQLLKSQAEYELRFAIVVLLSYYIDEESIDSTLLALEAVKSDAYYVRMANAWAVSICFVKFRDKTFALLKKNTLDTFTHNKAIQKIRESFRVSDEDKQLLNKMKR